MSAHFSKRFVEPWKVALKALRWNVLFYMMENQCSLLYPFWVASFMKGQVYRHALKGTCKGRKKSSSALDIWAWGLTGPWVFQWCPKRGLVVFINILVVQQSNLHKHFLCVWSPELLPLAELNVLPLLEELDSPALGNLLGQAPGCATSGNHPSV